MWSPESMHVSTSKYFLLHRAEIIKLNVCSMAQSYLTLCGSVDCSPPASSVHEIFHAGILEQVAISFSRRSSWPRDWTHISYVSCIGRWILYPSATFILHYMQVFNFVLFYKVIFLTWKSYYTADWNIFISKSIYCYVSHNWTLLIPVVPFLTPISKQYFMFQSNWFYPSSILSFALDLFILCYSIYIFS